MNEWSVVHKVALWGFLGAFLFGIVAHKTHFCTMGAISDWINMGSFRRLRAWLLAIAVALLVSQLLQAIGWIYLSTNFGIGGHIIGGFLFGVGMTLGGGCGQRTLVRRQWKSKVAGGTAGTGSDSIHHLTRPAGCGTHRCFWIPEHRSL